MRNKQKINNVASKRKRGRKTVLNDEFIQEAQLELIEGSVTVGHVLREFAALKNIKWLPHRTESFWNRYLD